MDEVIPIIVGITMPVVLIVFHATASASPSSRVARSAMWRSMRPSTAASATSSACSTRAAAALLEKGRGPLSQESMPISRTPASRAPGSDRGRFRRRLGGHQGPRQWP